MIAEGLKSAAAITDWEKVPRVEIATGITRQMITGENVMVCRFTFAPFVVTDEHTHPHEQITLVVKGKVKFVIEGEVTIVSPGDVLHFPSNNRHGATMLDEEVVLIDIFSPPREDFLATGHNGTSA